jgi:hypothetical protein
MRFVHILSVHRDAFLQSLFPAGKNCIQFKSADARTIWQILARIS